MSKEFIGDKSNFFNTLMISRRQEFHATLGSMITCQVPDNNYISKDVFDLINVYILPKRELERQILTVNTLGIKIVGYPVKYAISFRLSHTHLTWLNLILGSQAHRMPGMLFTSISASSAIIIRDRFSMKVL